MTELLIRGGHLFDLQRSEAADVSVRDGVIAEVGPTLTTNGSVLDVSGKIVMPGM